jgi:hypothetical protein
MNNENDTLAEDFNKALEEFAKKLLDSQEDLHPTLKEAISEDLWDLYEE